MEDTDGVRVRAVAVRRVEGKMFKLGGLEGEGGRGDGSTAALGRLDTFKRILGVGELERSPNPTAELVDKSLGETEDTAPETADPDPETTEDAEGRKLTIDGAWRRDVLIARVRVSSVRNEDAECVFAVRRSSGVAGAEVAVGDRSEPWLTPLVGDRTPVLTRGVSFVGEPARGVLLALATRMLSKINNKDNLKMTDLKPCCHPLSE